MPLEEKTEQEWFGDEHRGIGLCYCRHKMRHVGRACEAPIEICMTFNNTAASMKSRYLETMITGFKL